MHSVKQVKRRSMMKIVTLFFILSFGAFSYLQAQLYQRYDPESVQNRRFEIGVMIGAPTGLNAKYWIDPRSTLDLAVAWLFEDEGYLEIHGDYLFHYLYPSVPRGLLPLYFGLGPAIRIGENDSFFGIRIPIGIEYFILNIPLSIFGEIGPRVEIIPNSSVKVAGGVGIRFVF